MSWHKDYVKKGIASFKEKFLKILTDVGILYKQVDDVNGISLKSM